MAGAQSRRADRPEGSNARDRLASLALNSPLILWAADAGGTLTLSEGAALSVLDLQPGQLVGENLFALFADRPDLVEDFHRTLAGEQFAAVRKFGGRAFETRYSPQRDAAGAVVGIAAVSLDVSERVEAQEQVVERENRLTELADTISEVFWAFDRGTQRMLYASPAFERVWGIPVPELLADYGVWQRSVHPDDRAEAEASFRAIASGDGGVGRHYRIVRPDGAIRWISDRGFAVRGASGDIERVVGIATDITARKAGEAETARALAEARDASEKLRHTVAQLERRTREAELLNDMGDMLQSCRTLDEAYAVVCRCGEQMFGGDAGCVAALTASHSLLEVRAQWGELQNHEAVFDADACWALRRGRAHRGRGAQAPVPCEAMGALCTCSYRCLPLVAYGEALGVLHLQHREAPAATCGEPAAESEAAASSFAERVSLALANLKLRESLRQQALEDPLTGLYNRRYMMVTLEREVRRARRAGQPLSVIMVDLDRFKELNDAHGHAAGDAVLCAVAGELNRGVREEDVACRYGGEEFVLVLPGVCLADAVVRANQLRRRVTGIDTALHGEATQVTMSAGVAALSASVDNGDELLRQADAALYRAKDKGRNRVEAAGDV